MNSVGDGDNFDAGAAPFGNTAAFLADYCGCGGTGCLLAQKEMVEAFAAAHGLRLPALFVQSGAPPCGLASPATWRLADDIRRGLIGIVLVVRGSSGAPYLGVARPDLELLIATGVRIIDVSAPMAPSAHFAVAAE